MSATTLTIALGEADLAALDRSIRQSTPALTREQALSAIVTAWARTQPGADRRAKRGGLVIERKGQSR